MSCTCRHIVASPGVVEDEIVARAERMRNQVALARPLTRASSQPDRSAVWLIARERGRLLANDHAAQAARAAAVFQSGPGLIPRSVLLETEWVLRHSCGLGTAAILPALRSVLGLANVSAEDSSAVVTALRLCEQRLEFADPLHVASSASA
jgi:hypothetical protein